MNQQVRIYPGGIVDVIKYAMQAVCGTATSAFPMYTLTVNSTIPPTVMGIRQGEQCVSCGARKEYYSGFVVTCAYCKNPK